MAVSCFPLHLAQRPLALHCNARCPGCKQFRHRLLLMTAAVLSAAD